MKNKEAMSETTSDTGQAELADEPSMEDILASIRKIIADDDQAMDLSEPQALETPGAFDSVADMAASDLGPAALIEDTQTSELLDFDENSVFNRLSDAADDAQEDSISSDETANQDTLSGDVMDLDIAALLSEADGSVEAEAPMISATPRTLTSKMSDDDALFDMIDLEMGDTPESLVIPEIEEVALVEASVETGESIFELTETIDTPDESFSVSESDNDDDSLFSKLEGLLADVPDEPAPAKDSTNLVSEASQESSQKAGIFGTSLAALGLAGAAKAKSDIADITEPVPELDASEMETNRDDDFDSMLEDLSTDLNLPSDKIESEIGANIEVTETSSTDMPSFSTDANDMTLVKSLMEDLTEPEAESHDDLMDDILDADAASWELEDAESDPDLELESENDTDSILDDILNMSLDDEIAGHEDELEIPTPETVVFEEPTAESVAADEAENIAESETSSLMDIAFAAEQEAEALETKAFEAKAFEADTESVADEPAIIESHETSESNLALETGLTASVLGAAAVVAAKAAEEKRQTTSEADEVEDTEIEPTHKNESQEETADMPRAVKSETILDDVTESAASEVFASLNQVVEENAIKAERGDRIGDLVMEALRPMLKEWLDANLKGIVERAVAKEVKRISTGK